MPPLLLGAAYRNGSHARQCADPEIVIVKLAATEYPATAAPVPVLDPMGQRTYPVKVRVNAVHAPTTADCSLESRSPRGLYIVGSASEQFSRRRFSVTASIVPPACGDHPPFGSSIRVCRPLFTVCNKTRPN
jgi:hypothetical protein